MQLSNASLTQNLATVLRTGRKQAGIQQSALARELGISQSYLSKLESGITVTPLSVWIHYCSMMNIPVRTGQYGYIDREKKNEISNIAQIGLFKIPERYAYLRGSITRSSLPFLRYLEFTLGAKKLRDFIQFKKLDPDYFMVLDNSLNINFNLDLLQEMIHLGLLSIESMPYIARFMAPSKMHGNMTFEYSYAQSRMQLLQMVSKNIEKYDSNWEYQFNFLNSTQVEIEISPMKHLLEFNFQNADVENVIHGFRACQFHQVLVDSRFAPPSITYQRFKVGKRSQTVYRIDLG